MALSTPTLGLALRRYLDARSAALVEARRALRINEMDARALLYAAANPGTRPTDLRAYLGITSAGITALIDRLEQRGAMRRVSDETDRRANRITVTVDMGAEPWSALCRFDDDVDKAINGCPTGEADRFADVLNELTRSASAA